jgi:type IV pilus assembly protein PilM
MPESIWKKEISFRRKPKAEDPFDAPEKQSIWKKEISLGRKKPPEAPPPPPPPPPVAIAPEPVPAPAPVPEQRLLHAAGDYEWRNESAEPPQTPVPVELVPSPVPQNVVHLAPAQVAVPEPAPEPQPALRKEKAKPERAPRAPRVSKRGTQLVGLKVGASQVAAARVVNNGAVELVQVARAELPAGLVVGGDLRDPDGLAEFLRSFFKQHRLPNRGIRLGVSNNRIGVRSFEIAGITDPKQLANAIRFRAQESLPIPIDDAVLDYRVLGEGKTPEGEPTRRILLVVAYRELVDRYVAACRKAGLTLAGIDLEAFALLRSLAPPRPDGDASDAALVAVAVGHERSTLAVSDGRVCEFTRVVEWGGSAITIAIARALDVSPLEAEPVKRAMSLAALPAIEGLTLEQLQAVDEAVRRQVHAFARELVSSLQFYQGQPGSLGIGEIVITGGTAHLPGLDAELERLIGVTVRIGDPLARVRLGKRVGEPEQLGSLAIAIGLGIED